MRDVRRLATVPRWGIVATIRRQSVAEHSYFVSLYVAGMCEQLALPIHDRAAALMYALTHDVAEAFTGDLAKPMKAHIEGLGALEGKIERHMLRRPTRAPSPLARSLVEVADSLDAAVFLIEECAMGNSRVSVLAEEMAARARARATPLGLDVFCQAILNEAKQPIVWSLPDA